MQWYYLLQGQRQGPVDDAGLELLVRQGIVQDDTLVWRDGLMEWQAYGAVKPKPAPPPRPEPPLPRPEPSLSLPEPVQSRPEPFQSRPEPFQPRPEPAQSRPEPRPEAPLPHAAAGGFGSAGYGAPPGAQPAAGHLNAPPLANAPSPGAPAIGGKGSRGMFFFYPVLEALNDGRIIRKSVIVVLKVLAVLIALGGVLAALTVLTTSLRGTGGMALGGILFAILLLGTAACVGQIYWYRAGSVAALEHSKNTVIPIFAILSRAGGEAAATGLAGVGLGACLFLWLSPEGAGGVLQGVPFMAQIPTEGGFLTGILVLVYLALLGFLALIFGYLWAECIMLLVDIERNTHKGV
jgi:hypothetical protein